jgi:beta-glucosidase/6-phospho-beta-glucosidase/beta-galactosidase
MVTISHCEMPLHLTATYDGWLSRDLIAYFEKFTRVGRMIIASPAYPLRPDPRDVVAAT